MTHPELGEHPHRVAAAVLYERPGDDLHRIRNGAERPALDARDAARLRVQADADRHLRRAAAGREDRVEDDVARDGHRVREVAVDLVQDVLRRPAQEDRARLRRRALGEEGEVPGESIVRGAIQWKGVWRYVLVADLFNVEETALCADVGFAQVLDAVDDGGADSTSDTVVVRLPYSPDRRDVRLVEEVLCVILERRQLTKSQFWQVHCCTHLRHPFQ